MADLLDDYHPPQPAAPTQAGPSGLLAQLMGGGGLGGAYGGYGGFGGYGMPAQPSAYDEYFKAYSVAVMGGNERPELMYGGKSKWQSQLEETTRKRSWRRRERIGRDNMVVAADKY